MIAGLFPHPDNINTSTLQHLNTLTHLSYLYIAAQVPIAHYHLAHEPFGAQAGASFGGQAHRHRR